LSHRMVHSVRQIPASDTAVVTTVYAPRSAAIQDPVRILVTGQVRSGTSVSLALHRADQSGAPSEMTSSGQPSPRSPSPVKNPSQASPDSDVAASSPTNTGLPAVPGCGRSGLALSRPHQRRIRHDNLRVSAIR
jgi:hypothetical protein